MTRQCLNASMNKKTPKIVFVLVAAAVLMAFGFILFHHHGDGEHHDCPVCAFIHFMAAACILFFMVVVFELCFRRSISVFENVWILTLFSSHCPKRGPPR